MSKVDLHIIEDGSDCEMCGSYSETGCIVKVDGEVVFEFIPIAHCYDSQGMDDDEIYAKVLEILGVKYKLHDDSWLNHDLFKSFLENAGHELSSFEYEAFDWSIYDYCDDEDDD